MPVTTIDRTRFAHVDITGHGQVRELSAVEDATPVPARYRIHHDTSYPAQSYAVAEVWSASDLAWHEAATYAAGLWAVNSGSAYSKPDNAPTQGIVDALKVLQLRVRRLLVP